MSDFDNSVFNYDEQFSFSPVGKAQRELVWYHIKKLKLKENQRVLEINCGTGEDAKRWKNINAEIVATDISPKMIELAKLKYPDVQFEVEDILAIQDRSEGTQNIIFSNFGGLNCLSSDQFKSFFKDAATILPPNGKLILVVMGKKCLWDKLFLMFKGRMNQINRRETNSFLEVNVDGTMVKTWYYSPADVKKLADSYFKANQLKPIGLFVPPSYLAKFFSNKKRILNLFLFLDKMFALKIFANYADHFFIVFNKKG